MNGSNIVKCRFCLKIIYDDGFDFIGEITRQMLNGLLLTLDLDKGSGAVMCHDCSRKLQNALDFKTACLDAENKVLPYVNSTENVKLAIKEESVVELPDSLQDQKSCRFCMKVGKSDQLTYLQEMKEHISMMDTILKHIPELHLNVTEELLACQTCFASLRCLVSFITVCSDAEEKIKQNMDGKDFAEINTGNANLTNIDERYKTYAAVFVKNEIKSEDRMEIDNLDLTTKAGENEVQMDQSECERLQSTSSSQLILGSIDEYANYSFLNKLGMPSQMEENISEIMYSCQMCSYKTKYEQYFKKHGIIHEKPSDVKMYKCDKCSYSAKLAGNLKKHMLIHQNPLEVQMYSCNICQFETKRKGTLIKHMRVHQDFSELPVYKCETCSFESKHKHSLERHVLIHKNPSELTVYKCESCDYETRHKSHLNAHMITHKSPSEIRMFYCEMCPFETKRKKALNKHLLIHQDPSEVTLFKCDQCVFETKRKDSLKNHLLTHQDQSEAITYKCDQCPFETKHKISLRRHYLTHQDPSEVTTYKCEKCSYSTMRKCHLKMHMRVHLNPSEMKMYNCELCPFETKHQRSFDRHLLRHC